MYDIIISGAGPAGSASAKILAEKGFKVALIEKDINYRKPCGGGIPSSRIYQFYPQLKKINVPRKNVATMFSADYHKFEVTIEMSETNGLVLDRLEFDNLVRNVAVDAGAELFDKNLSLDFIYENQQKVGIKTRTPSGVKEYRGKIFIIADGMSSKLAIRSKLRDKWDPLNIGIGKAEILEGQNNLNENCVYFFFKHYGYCWIFPIDKQRFNVGSITYFENNLKCNSSNLYKEFLKEPFIRKLIPENEYKVIWSASYPEPANGVLEKSLYDDNIMLVGDAAGFAAPISGEGILPAIISGHTAGEIAIKALEKEDFSSNTLKEFKKHPEIKSLIRKFKFQRKFVNFFYENDGQNLNSAFKLAGESEEFMQILVDTFIFSKTPPKDFIQKIKNIKI